ncbi:NADP-dependent phosphogluconate dehydrogenase [Profundibacter amoris]|uniref:6-phosphogluconate dehydrogenase, decarboxylating n=1 Tax=Profundibacter amoris TaxID=2171755 RepID=A0A347UE81_9RHOB|nr:NADP-dependent phosphogluconate dehydrogenase [Profundibacter amoris]AXX97159.1 NADP-dependent phosphogluconate dehydrogenase [Profundibacter amoris]
MSKAQIGVYGLGTMGSALALNMAEHGFQVAVTNREVDWIAPFMQEAGDLAKNLHPFDTLEEFIQGLATPRVILFMIPSTKPMDMMIEAVTPLLEPGDTIIDGGNANFHDTRRRSALMAKQDLHFVGMGVSGGESGARHGPSMMVGGTKHSWTQLKPILQEIAAKYQGDPCVDHLGPDGAGHFVKTAHNGIEYADMQAIAEIYALLRDVTGWDAPQIGALFEGWNDGPLHSYLIGISGKVLQATDPETGKPVVDLIVDQAGQKGTGRWTVIEALKLGQSASAIEGAVGARAWSAEKETRKVAQGLLTAGTIPVDLPDADDLQAALLAARILGHAQGFRVLQAASDEYDWSLNLPRIAEIWRAGCIIRSSLLDDLADALRSDPPQGELILAPAIRASLDTTIAPLRRVVASAVTNGIPVPALTGALAWYDSIRTARGSTNLIQAQRDFFGEHGFIRIDKDGVQHGPWNS